MFLVQGFWKRKLLSRMGDYRYKKRPSAKMLRVRELHAGPHKRRKADVKKRPPVTSLELPSTSSTVKVMLPSTSSPILKTNLPSNVKHLPGYVTDNTSNESDTSNDNEAFEERSVRIKY
jgi:hypothetical protein